MSHNTEPERAMRRHPAAIIGIILALVVAGVALVWWMGADPVAEDDVSRTAMPEAPAGTPAAGSPPEN
ncbi:hypothetical protein [Paracoccus aestuariivivens]|uniref:Uncharacterized protein n=1 Tax=Paracoccus aestuariivivens TaxID=1820333 RepID=A0A6L6JJB4_9RHOB|nr:hypothetical protein [Paracoccus aestuariivivens]MTH79941.1 hypothetical protein [Paracoccus aestuariivivens]